jgi:hypothetical protein
MRSVGVPTSVGGFLIKIIFFWWKKDMFDIIYVRKKVMIS